MRYASFIAPWLILATWLALSPFWIQKESLWIDEAGSAIKAMASSPQGVWEELCLEKNSNMHLPAYHFYLWGAVQLLGNSEYALRAANLPWMLLGYGALILGLIAFARPSQAIWLALFLTTNPFLFYYTNEVRPYAMQFGLAAVAFSGLMGTKKCGFISWKAWGMVLATVLLAWTTIYGLAWWIINLLFWAGSSLRSEKKRLWTWTIGFLFLGGFCAFLFHLWVLGIGAKASPVGETGIKSIAYAFCEWTGAAGFLPGRSSLRCGALPSLNEFLVASATAGLTVALLISGAIQARFLATPLLYPVAWTIPSLGIIASGLLKSFRLVGRHFTPSGPSFFWFLSLGPKISKRFHWTHTAAIALLLLWTASNYRLATELSHRKDDYRGAVQWLATHAQKGETIWWAADDAAARFYGLKDWTLAMNLIPSLLASMPQPAWIALSKPDVYDAGSALQNFITQKQATPEARFQSFEIYLCPASPQ